MGKNCCETNRGADRYIWYLIAIESLWGASMTVKTFAWQKGLRGPVPVLFHHGIPVCMETNKPRDENIVDKFEIPNDPETDLDKLAIRYPLAA